MDRAHSPALGAQLVVALAFNASVEMAPSVAWRVSRSAGAHRSIELFADVVTDE